MIQRIIVLLHNVVWIAFNLIYTEKFVCNNDLISNYLAKSTQSYVNFMYLNDLVLYWSLKYSTNCEVNQSDTN